METRKMQKLTTFALIISLVCHIFVPYQDNLLRCQIKGFTMPYPRCLVKDLFQMDFQCIKKSEMPLLTALKVGKVGKTCSTFI